MTFSKALRPFFTNRSLASFTPSGNSITQHLSLPMRLAISSPIALPASSLSVARITLGALSSLSLASHKKRNLLSSCGSILPSTTFITAPFGTLTTFSNPASINDRASISPSTIKISSVGSRLSKLKKFAGAPLQEKPLSSSARIFAA